MTLAERLEELVRAAFAGLWVVSHEHDDAVAEIAALCRRHGWSLATWDIDRGLAVAGRPADVSAVPGAADPLAAVRARFEEAVRLAEQAFIEEFARLIDHITERLSDTGDDGSPKVFRDSAVGNLSEFFQRFKELNVRSNAQLDELVERAQRAVRGVGAQDLRDSQGLRQRVAQQLTQVQSALDGLLIDRPRRRILRQPAAGSE